MVKILDYPVRLGFFAFVLAGAGCVGNEPAPGSSSAGSTSSISADLAQQGKAYWDSQCASCHSDVSAKSMVKEYTLVELEQKIRLTMPLAVLGQNPADCAGECSEAVAAYIAANNPNFGNVVASNDLAAPLSKLDPAPVPYGRLSGFEYDNTVRDLFGTSLQPSKNFPPDALVYGFTNIRSNLTTGGLISEQWFSVAEQLASEAVASGNNRVIKCNASAGATCARETIQNFGLKAWRRPLSNTEADSLFALYTGAGDFTNGMRQVIKAMLLSPNFNFRIEADQNPTSGLPRNLNGYELASRLSYFLWASTPDDTLLQLAGNGTLTEPSTLKTQVARMIRDPRSDTLINKALTQWLRFSEVEDATPDASFGVNNNLKDNMLTETRMFVEHWFRNNSPVSELLTADYTYLNEALADFYGESGVFGANFRLHKWESSERRGILAHGSILTVTSHPAKTSPVRRGLYVVNTLTCQEPPPPPAGVIPELPVQTPGMTRRQLFELHRADPGCASCHALMDPIGFGLENFDPVGRWRYDEDGTVIDAGSQLPNGDSFTGAAQLGEVLSGYARIPMCVAGHLMTYALGRGVKPWHHEDPTSDYPALYDIYQQTKSNGHRIVDMIEAIVMSPAFRQRRGADSEGIE